MEIERELVKKIRFAGDKRIIANTEKDFRRLISSLDKVIESYGMKISIINTKVMQIARKKRKNLNIKIKDQTLKVEEFKYLRRMLITDAWKLPNLNKEENSNGETSVYEKKVPAN